MTRGADVGAAPRLDALDQFVAGHNDELVAFRRDMHAHPELAHAEFRATSKVVTALTAAGLQPHVLPGGAGLWVDVGSGNPIVAVRADLDALPIDDPKQTAPYRSTVPGACHACGHDVHTTVALGTALALAEVDRREPLSGRVRVVFEPAEEANPGGALDVLATGAMDGVRQIFALHCDPRLDVGQLGLRAGPLTGSSDHLLVWVASPGGHTARPHLTGDVVYALSKVVTDVPSVLSRRVDPRAGLSVVWGQVTAGHAANVIPQDGFAQGTVRTLDAGAWQEAPKVVTDCVRSIASPYGVDVQVEYRRGVPPVVNDAGSVETFRTAANALGDVDVHEVEQSLGGEDFAWFLEQTPGALARLGVRTPGTQTRSDLHQGEFDVDERAIAVGVRVLTRTALAALAGAG